MDENKQEKEQKQEETEPQQVSAEENATEEERGATEKIWDATLKTWSSATFRANQYRRVVQKKIDLTSIHKKIAAAHSDLGNAIDNLRQGDESSILEHQDVVEIFQKLDSLRTAAATLEEEIVAIKAELPPEEPEEGQD
ncbi:MAG: hypothetical protein C0616_00050 [Desulfuromonas sp.]|nr:MAG: hypothetical protein C0616_00050 [Desulfuromonas sp.]